MHLLSRSWFTVVRKSQGGLRAGVARWLLVLCAMQAAMALLGQMHQIAHAPLPLAVPANNGAAVDSGNEKATTGNSWFGAHTAGDCQLFQHHALAGAGFCWPCWCWLAAMRHCAMHGWAPCCCGKARRCFLPAARQPLCSTFFDGCQRLLSKRWRRVAWFR